MNNPAEQKLQVEKFINETICDSDPKQIGFVFAWMIEILKHQKSLPPLILEKTPKDVEAFLSINLSLVDIQFPGQNNYLEVKDIDECQISDLFKYKIIIFNGFKNHCELPWPKGQGFCWMQKFERAIA